MDISSAKNSPTTQVKLKPVEATPETFEDYGQIIESSKDGEEFGPRDAQLDLSKGVPRFYIMRLTERKLKFSTITHHASVTQCLGAIGGGVWFLGVARPSIVEVDASEHGRVKHHVVKSHCGHFYVLPEVNDVQVFKVEGPKFLKLHRGTWHAGPLFLDETMDFYNLELSNTNVSVEIWIGFELRR
uniref:Ureidoglycolate hydrolase n=1 Tax=Kalanchoe fedtschenkoi TaxID=63787 RepID=A0A7N0ZZW8_KALFE